MINIVPDLKYLKYFGTFTTKKVLLLFFHYFFSGP